IIQIPVAEPREDRVQCVSCAADVHDEPVSVERGSTKLDVDHVGRSMKALGRTKHGASKAVGDHHVTANRDAVHVNTLCGDTTYRTTPSRDRSSHAAAARTHSRP